MIASRLLSSLGFALSLAALAPLARAENIVFPADAGVINVKAWTLANGTPGSPQAVGNGIADDTAAFNAVFAAYPNGNRIIYVPNGTYRVTDTIRFGDNVNNGKRLVLQGQSQAGTIIRLANNTPAFATYTAPGKAVIFAGNAPAQRFRNGIRNLTLSTGTGNPGAVGIQFNCSNQGGIRDVTIVSEDGAGKFGLDLGYTNEVGPGYFRGITVRGFDIGVRTENSVNSMTFEYLTLERQNVYGLENANQVFTVRKLTSNNSVPAVHNTGPNAVMTLLDANLYGYDSFARPAVLNNGTLVARDVRQTGYDLAIRNNTGTQQSAHGTYVTEFVSNTPYAQFSPSRPKSLRLAVQDPPDIPWESDLTQWANPMSFGAGGTGSTDDSDAIQAAIDSGKTTLYFPGGRTFKTAGRIFIRGNIRRIIGTEGRVQGSGTFVLDNVAGSPPAVIFERSYTSTGLVNVEQRGSRTLVISSCLNLGIYGYGPGDIFLEDVTALPFVFLDRTSKVFARQLNPEGGNASRAKITVDGGQLWLLGLKTEEGDSTAIEARNAAKLELLGAHIYSNESSPVPVPVPMFVVNNAAATLAGVGETAFSAPISNPYNEIVRETRGASTLSLFKNAVSIRNNGARLSFYSGSDPNPDNYVYTPVVPPAPPVPGLVLSASSNNEGSGSSDNAADGSLTSRWATNNTSAGAFYLQLKLDQVRTVTSLSAAWFRGEIRNYNFAVFASVNGTTFTQVFPGAPAAVSNLNVPPNGWAQSPLTPNAASTTTGVFSPAVALPANTSARYVRVVVYGSGGPLAGPGVTPSPTSNFCSAWEFAVVAQ